MGHWLREGTIEDFLWDMVRQRFLSVPDVSDTRTAKSCMIFSWFVQPWTIFRRVSHNTGES